MLFVASIATIGTLTLVNRKKQENKQHNVFDIYLYINKIVRE